MIQIGIIDANDMLIEATLSDNVYHIGLSWNEEAQQWSMSLRDLNLSVLASGMAVVPNWPMLRYIRRPEFPPGDIVFLTPKYTPITRRTFMEGKSYMFYFDDSSFENL